MDAVQVWEEALHAFGSGATGFSFFGVFFHGCFDDPGKLLALSSAVSLASPFEHYFLDGVPLVRGALTANAGKIRAWSGVRFESKLWLVITPGDSHGHTRPSTLTLQVQAPELGDWTDTVQGDRHAGSRSFPGTYSACDLTTGRNYKVQTAGGSLTIIDLQLTRTAVLHIATDNLCEKLPSDVWLPEPGYNFIIQ